MSTKPSEIPSMPFTYTLQPPTSCHDKDWAHDGHTQRYYCDDSLAARQARRRAVPVTVVSREYKSTRHHHRVPVPKHMANRGDVTLAGGYATIRSVVTRAWTWPSPSDLLRRRPKPSGVAVDMTRSRVLTTDQGQSSAATHVRQARSPQFTEIVSMRPDDDWVKEADKALMLIRSTHAEKAARQEECRTRNEKRHRTRMQVACECWQARNSERSRLGQNGRQGDETRAPTHAFL